MKLQLYEIRKFRRLREYAAISEKFLSAEGVPETCCIKKTFTVFEI